MPWDLWVAGLGPRQPDSRAMLTPLNPNPRREDWTPAHHSAPNI